MGCRRKWLEIEDAGVGRIGEGDLECSRVLTWCDLLMWLHEGPIALQQGAVTLQVAIYTCTYLIEDHRTHATTPHYKSQGMKKK